MILLALVLSTVVFAASPGPQQPPKTGQATSVLAGDDGKLQIGRSWPATRFVDNSDGTLTDGLTGLVWLKDANCARNSEFLPQATTGEWSLALKFAERLNSDSLSGHCEHYTAHFSDWRTPNINELTSLMRADVTPITGWLELPGAVNSSGFNNVSGFGPDALAWSSTTVADHPDQAWVADLHFGGIAMAPKVSISNTYYVFSAVRNFLGSNVPLTGQNKRWATDDDGDAPRGRRSANPRFVIGTDGTVIDKATGLMWFQAPNCLSQGVAWANSLTLFTGQNAGTATTCPSFTANHVDWRLPNLFELQSLLDFGQAGSALPAGHPFSLGSLTKFWTSTPGKAIPNTAWAVDVSTGTLHGQNVQSMNFGVWPVRGPASYPDIDIITESDSTADKPHFTLKNVGNKELTISGVKIATQDSTTQQYQTNVMFNVTGPSCAGKVLLKGATCDLRLEKDYTNLTRQAVFAVISSDALALPESAVILKIADPPLPPPDESADDYKCFIATAAFGSQLDPEVRQLRQFRNEFMLRSVTGSALVSLYYATAPPIAHFISKHPFAKTVVRTLLTPIAEATRSPLLTAFAGLSLSFVLLQRRQKQPTATSW